MRFLFMSMQFAITATPKPGKSLTYLSLKFYIWDEILINVPGYPAQLMEAKPKYSC